MAFNGSASLDTLAEEVFGDVYLGYQSTGSGSWTGAKGIIDQLYIGYEGTGYLGISASEDDLIVDGSFYVARESGSSGQIDIALGSIYIEALISPYIGYNGPGSLNITDGGSFTSQRGLRVAYYTGANDSSLSISNRGELSLDTSLWLGYQGRASLTLSDGGVTTVGTDFLVSGKTYPSSSGASIVRITDPGDDDPGDIDKVTRLDIASNAYLGAATARENGRSYADFSIDADSQMRVGNGDTSSIEGAGGTDGYCHFAGQSAPLWDGVFMGLGA
ncbi:MAG: hypothetical protein ACPGN3_00760, partial [Opitutales bacterium]